VEAVVAQAFVGEALQGRRVRRATERARLAEADVVQQHRAARWVRQPVVRAMK
jgi:hypothetical protein